MCYIIYNMTGFESTLLSVRLCRCDTFTHQGRFDTHVYKQIHVYNMMISDTVSVEFPALNINNIHFPHMTCCRQMMTAIEFCNEVQYRLCDLYTMQYASACSDAIFPINIHNTDFPYHLMRRMKLLYRIKQPRTHGNGHYFVIYIKIWTNKYTQSFVSFYDHSYCFENNYHCYHFHYYPNKLIPPETTALKSIWRNKEIHYLSRQTISVYIYI